MDSTPPNTPDGNRKSAPYLPFAGQRDEAKDASGLVRPGWSELFESIDRHGDRGLQKWRSESLRIARKRGLAYHPSAIEGNKPRGDWELDPVPWIISPKDWITIEAGIGQRTRLFEAILADLYGPQHIISEKLVPPEIIFGHHGFFPDLWDLKPGTNVIGLGISAVDIVFANHGKLFALNDRFDCPFGLGVTLENRTVVNSVLPNLFRRCQVRRMGYFYRDWFNYLAARAPNAREFPRIVIVDATPADQDSEISFLANYCGITRVTDADLTVRDGKVFLKALTGLEQIDLIWKNAAGRDLDPLESRRRSPGGIPGVFEAIRAGNVAMASHPGCEVLQSPGLYPFLEQICEKLLSEPLKIPPVATWWCGARNARQHVLQNLSNMVIKSVWHHSDFKTVYGRHLSSAEIADIKAQIEAEPHRFVGQEELNISTVPVATDQGLKPRGAVMRGFSFLDLAGKARVMPGGLGRVSTEDGIIVSTRNAGESKDIWVRSNLVDSPISIPREMSKSRLTTLKIIPSKTAENLFWAGRYAERTDFISRFATRILDGRTFGFSHDREIEIHHEELLLTALCELNHCRNWLENATDPDSKIHLLLSVTKCPVSIAFNLAKFRSAAYATRETWSRASIRAIESIWNGWINATGGLTSINDYQPQLEETQLQLSAFLGLNFDSMTRDEPWAVLQAGRRLERAANTVGLLGFLLNQQVEHVLEQLMVESILFISDSLGTYQNKFLDEPLTGPMLQLLLGDRGYPRSVRFQIDCLDDVLSQLPPPKGFEHPREKLKPAAEMLDEIVVKNRKKETLPTARIAFSNDLQTLKRHLRNVSDHLTQSYFSHAAPPAEE